MAHPLLDSTLHDNPITRAERNYQRRTVVQRKWRRFPTAFGLVLAIALITSASLLIAPQVAPLIGMTPDDLRDLLRGWFGTIMIALGALIMFQHLTFALTGMQLASAAIAREKQAHTWESLVLTGVDARRIVFGKWSATMRTLWQAYRPLLILRFVVALWMGFADRIAQFNAFLEPPPLLITVALGIIIAVFPLVYASFTTALGLVASLLMSSALAAQRVASVLHFATVGFSLGMIALLFSIPYGSFDVELATLMPALFVTPLDGGMLALVGMIAGGGAPTNAYLIGLLLCVILYGLLAALTLRTGQALAVRSRALPPSQDRGTRTESKK